MMDNGASALPTVPSAYGDAWRAKGLPPLADCPLPGCYGEGQYDAPSYAPGADIRLFCSDCGLMIDNTFGGDFGCIETWNARTPEEVDALHALDQYHYFLGDYDDD